VAPFPSVLDVLALIVMSAAEGLASHRRGRTNASAPTRKREMYCVSKKDGPRGPSFSWLMVGGLV